MCSFTVLEGPGGSENQSVSGVTTICLTQCNTSPSHRVDQVVVVACGMLVHSSSMDVRICWILAGTGTRCRIRDQSEKKIWTVAQWSKVLFSDESKFCISFVNQGPRVWSKGGVAHSTSFLKSSVKFPQSVMIWVQCHLLVLVYCVFWKPRHCTCLPRNVGALHASFCWPAF